MRERTPRGGRQWPASSVKSLLDRARRLGLVASEQARRIERRFSRGRWQFRLGYARNIPRCRRSSHVTGDNWAVGKNLAVRLPADVAKAAGFGDGERVEVLPQKGRVVIRKVAPSITVDEMFRGKKPEEWRELYTNAYDWGDDRGREIVEE